VSPAPEPGHGRVDWRALMAVGLGALRLAPDVFWAMTPVELAAALEGAGLVRRPSAPSRRTVLDLMARFPDTTETRDGEFA